MKKKGLMMIIKKYVVVFIILVMIGIKCEEIASDKKIIDSKNSTANKSKVKLRDASVTISEDNTNNDLLKENSVYINKYETSKENCLENCIECEEEKIVKTQVKNGTTNSYKKCKRCEENFLIFEGVCYGMINKDVIISLIILLILYYTF